MKKLLSVLLVVFCSGVAPHAFAKTEATFYTSMGNFKVELEDVLAPVTVDSFIARVTEKFYDGLTFHRVIANFVIQGGDPLGNGYGDAGYTLPDEYDATLKNTPGTIAMANEGTPHTGSCQFYFNLVNNSSLNNHYTVFGAVTENFSVVQSIGQVTTDANDKPITTVLIDSIRITKYNASVADETFEHAVSISPNPGNGMFHITLPGVATDLSVINICGQTVYTTQASGSCDLDLLNQPVGIYMLRLNNVHGSLSRKLLLQR